MNYLINIFSLFSDKEKKQFLSLLVLMFFVALVDVAGIASILPMITFLVSDQTLFPFKETIFSALNLDTPKDQTLALIAIFLTVFLTGQALRVTLIRKQIYFAMHNERSLGIKLLQKYIYFTDTIMEQKHSADINKTILSEVSHVMNQAVLPSLLLITQFLILLLILIFLIILYPKQTIFTILIAGFFYLSILWIFKKKLTQAGKQKKIANETRFQVLINIASLIKEITVFRKQSYFVEKFVKPATEYANAQVTAATLAYFPRYVMEGVAVTTALCFLFWQIYLGKPSEEILPLLAVYAFAGYRVLPAIQQIYSSITSLRYSLPIVNDIRQRIIVKSSNQQSFTLNGFDGSFQFRTLEFKNVAYRYPDTKDLTFSKINFVLKRGEIVGIKGPTGSGKSTLISLIIGLTHPSEGRISINKKSFKGFYNPLWLNSIGYVPQTIKLLDGTIRESVAFGISSDLINNEQVILSLKISSAWPFVKKLENTIEHSLTELGSNLSGGQQQRLAIARAIYVKPQFLILDEATSALDLVTQELILKNIRDLGITTILITHSQLALSFCDRKYILENKSLREFS